MFKVLFPLFFYSFSVFAAVGDLGFTPCKGSGCYAASPKLMDVTSSKWMGLSTHEKEKRMEQARIYYARSVMSGYPLTDPLYISYSFT